MFGILKKRLHKEHSNLVSQNRQMTSELLQFYEAHAKMLDDPESRERVKFLSELTEELKETAVWLDDNDHLPHEQASGLLDLQRALSSQVEQIQRYEL